MWLLPGSLTSFFYCLEGAAAKGYHLRPFLTGVAIGCSRAGQGHRGEDGREGKELCSQQSVIFLPGGQLSIPYKLFLSVSLGALTFIPCGELKVILLAISLCSAALLAALFVLLSITRGLTKRTEALCFPPGKCRGVLEHQGELGLINSGQMPDAMCHGGCSEGRWPSSPIWDS